MATGSRDDAERRFWERYRNPSLKQGVKPSAVRWYVLRAECFIQSFSGRRLAELARQDVDDHLARLGQDSRLQPRQFRPAVHAIRNLYSIVHTEWADGVDWEFWRDSARTLEEQHATTAREHAPVTQEEFAKRIGESRFTPLIREHLDVFARFSTVMRTQHLSIRTEKSYLGWCCRFLSRFGGSGPENLGAPAVTAFLEELAVRGAERVCEYVEPGAQWARASHRSSPPFLFLVSAARRGQIKITDDVFLALVKFLVKIFSFHTALPLVCENASQK